MRLPSLPRPRFASRMVLGLVPGLLLVMGLAVGANYYIASRQILAGVQREVKGLARQSASALSAFCDQRKRDALQLAESPLVRDYQKYIEFGLTQEAETARHEVSAYYRRFALQDGSYGRIALWDPHGRELAWGGPPVPTPPFLPPGDPIPRGEARHSDLPPEETVAIHFWSGVFDEQGRRRGSVVLSCDLAAVRRRLAGMAVGRTGRTLLVDDAGRVLLGEAPPSPGAVVSEARVPGAPFRVRLAANPDEFLGPLAWVQRWTAVALLLSALAMTLWIRLWSRRVSRPIEEMAEGTRHLAGGDLDFRFSPHPIAELSALGEAFNDMARSLKERTGELEARIRELTALREMEGAVIQRLDEEAILRTALRAICQGLALDRAGLYWLERERGRLAGRYVHGAEASGLTEAAFRRRSIPLEGSDILSEVVRTRSSVLIRDRGKGDSRVDPAIVEESRTREFVLAPLLGTDRVYGVIAGDRCYTGRPLSESDREGLTLFAHAAGLAIQNASLFEGLARSEARARTILENAPVAILGVSGAQHHVVTWSLGAERIFGWSPSEAVGKPLTVLFAPESTQDYLRLMSTVVEKGSIRDFPISGRAKDGRGLDLSLSWGGALPGFWMNSEWTVVIRDVTESRKLQQQVIRSEKLSAVGQLISGIAHELNNPLQAVLGYAQLVSREAAPRLRPDLKLIVESAEICRKIIDNLLLFVRQGTTAKHAVSVPRAVRASLELMRYKLSKTHDIRLDVSLPRDLPEVEADFQQLQQVLLNLVNNACDALEGSTGPKRIAISASPAGEAVRVSVADNGPGIPPAIREKVFEPFFSTKPEGAGTGLGLALCRQIVQDHGGRMWLEEGEGGGSSFCFELPAAGGAGRRAPAPPPRPRARKGASILVVDDDSAVVALLRRALERDGHRVACARSLSEAAARAARSRFALVVADVHVGEGGGGLQLFEGWGRLSARPRPPFLFLTGDLMSEGLRRRLGPAGAALLYKPVDLGDLRAAVARLLSPRSLHA